MHPSNAPLGIALMVLAMCFNSTKDGLAKLLATGYPPLMLLFMQFLFIVLVLSVVVGARYGAAALLPKNIAAQLVRGAFVAIGVGLYYWAVNFIPIADATAMVFVAPLVVTALSPIALGEPLGMRRTAAVVAGFIGVLVILRPDLEGARMGYFIALGAGVFIGLFYLSNRKLADGTAHLVSTFYTSLAGFLILLPAVPFFWSEPHLADFWPLISFVSLAMIGQVLMISAFAYAAANLIAPFIYTQIIAATTVGIIMFDAFPDNVTWIGIAIVVAAGLYIAIREGRLAKAETRLKPI
ncbi:MAG: DMT family transporter [Rhodospirillales bacterium]|nr:DMT family transporter [Rhodospirillales bacterium]